MRTRGLLLVGMLALAAGIGSASAGPGASSVAVTLLVRGNPAARLSVKPSSTVSLLARASMRASDRLRIVAARGTQAARRTVVTCELSPCPGTWHEATAVTVRFQALLLRRSGGKLAVAGRSRVVSVTWKAPPRPLPKPAATPGHYEGRTSQNEVFRFDITADGLGVVNLQTGEINQSCEPHLSLSDGAIGPLPDPSPVDRDGSFGIESSGVAFITGPTIIDSVGGTYKYLIIGHVTGASGSGTLKRQSAFTYRGVTYACSSGDVTWTATKT